MTKWARNQSGSLPQRRFRFNYFLFILTYFMMFLGVLFIAVATFNPSISAGLPLINQIANSTTARWQAIFTIASPVVVSVIVSIPYEKFKRYARYFYYLIVGALLVVTATKSIRNVSAWFQLFLGRMLQPSEFAKIAIILLLAEQMENNDSPMSTVKDTLKLFLIVGLPAAITFVQGEAGSIIVMAAIFYVMIYFGGASWKWVISLMALALIGVGALFGYGIISGSDNYRLLRLLSFLDPHKYAQSAGLQILNSQEAIGSGGKSGIGLFVIGSHSQLNFVPEDWTDFIFATVGEAVGFIGCVILIFLYVIMILYMVYLSRHTEDKYGRLIIVGVMAMIFFHVFQNLAMTVGLMPITGIPLPFISYGGSNLLTNVIGISLVLNVDKNRGQMNPVQDIILLNPVGERTKKVKGIKKVKDKNRR